MTDLEFHLQNCSACRKGLACATRRMLGGLVDRLRGWLR